MKFTLVFVTLFFANFANSYNILVTVVSLSGSQNLIMYRLAETLGKRGHDVTVLKKEFFKGAKAPKLVHSKEISYSMFKDTERMKQLEDDMTKNTETWTPSGGGLSFATKVFKNLNEMLDVMSSDCESFLRNEEMLETIKSKKFDVIIMHFADFCSYGMAHSLGINGTILMSTAFMTEFMALYSGSPSYPSYIVSGHHVVEDRMTFVQRFKNTISAIFVASVFQIAIERTYSNDFRQRYGPGFPSLGQLMYKTQLFFINSDPFFEYPRPVPHNVVYVGGLTMKDPEPLTEEWNKIITGAGDAGVVVFSLGSIVNTSVMPSQMKLAFVNAFKRIKQNVIWRLEGDTSVVQNAPNIHVAKWLPQKDLLGHPKVKAFITHGGYNSLTEATYLGVPLIMFPLFGDQYVNCKRVERLKVGVTLYRDDIDENKILTALNNVLNSSEIQNNARRLGRMIRNKPESSYDLAVKWVEYLAEFQNLDQLRPASLELNLIQYFLIDVGFTLLLGFIISVFVFFKCCAFLAKKTVRREGKRKTE